MFLKNASKNKTISITYRLTLFYMLSAFGILAAITGYLYFALMRNLDGEDNQFLVEKIHDLRTILKEHPDNMQLLQEEVNEGEDSPFVNYVRILDEKGATVLEFSKKENTQLAALFPEPVEIDEDPVRGWKKSTPDGRLYLLMSAWAKIGGAPAEKRLLQAALDISREQEILNEYKNKVLGMLVLGVLFSAAAGFFIARKGMQPLQDITGVIRKIRSTKLHERVNPSLWPRELTELAFSFDQLLDHLQNSFSRLSQFSSNLAHELRNPINTLMGEAEVVLSKPRTHQEYQSHIELNLEEYEKLANIIKSLLFLAKAESTDIILERTVFDVSAEIHAMLEYYDALIEQQHIAISVQGAASLNADLSLFRRVISNILSNSIRYTPSGGKIDISIWQDADHVVSVQIRDTGIGIEASAIEKVFDRFYRSDKAKTASGQGTGLGLAIAKSIMDLHGGSIQIQSPPGHGTIVTLTFPLPVSCF